MSKFKPMELIDKMSGKFHSKSKYYAAEKYGTQYTGLVGEINVEPTAAQVANRTKFATARANVKALIISCSIALLVSHLVLWICSESIWESPSVTSIWLR